MIEIDKENNKTFNILLVEDNLGDVRLTQEALKESKLYYELFIAMDGEEALDFLQKKGKFEEVPTSDFILLDLNLPKKNGRRMLAEIKVDPKLKHIPVVILTTSEMDNDIERCYELHADCFITKPMEFEKLFEMIKKVEDFWLSIVKLPRRE